jgi:hypothetical protein
MNQSARKLAINSIFTIGLIFPFWALPTEVRIEGELLKYLGYI